MPETPVKPMAIEAGQWFRQLDQETVYLAVDRPRYNHEKEVAVVPILGSDGQETTLNLPAWDEVVVLTA